MKFLQFILLIALTSFLVACNKTDDETNQAAENAELVFGHYYGECAGETCVEIFKLTRSQLLEDKNDPYAGQGELDFTPLSIEKFQLVSELVSKVPDELLAEEDQTFGCPDCGDWGGIFVQWIDGGQTQEWQIDMVQESIPDYLHEFVAEINAAIALINQ